MDRYLCVHGHFYQPPRDNPWLFEIEQQDSAYPFHDWNERITAECYAPNAVSRILDEERHIVAIRNNYARMSFNFGPTLLAWLQRKQPKVYQAILAADKQSKERFAGHGSAIAQVYNHMILPLANARDRKTQVEWGIADFEQRFGRQPEGMWLAETAVDRESLAVLAEHGIRFTILAPHQASGVREIGTRLWRSVENGHIDTRKPYVAKLRDGLEIAVFFYDGPTSRAVAFENLLQKGETFAHRLLTGFEDNRQGPQMVHIATDGETFGHHHAHGDMALAYGLHYVEAKGLAKLTNYGEFLDICSPTEEVEILDNTSWSCAHGVERWRSDCGCSTGGLGSWNQRWRAPLRDALDWLRDTLAERYEERAGLHLKDPWAARDAAISLDLDPSTEALERFLSRHQREPLDDQERATVLKLLELQRNAQLMYTSCAWFFNDISGIETVQCLQYAGRALQLGEELFGAGLEEPLLRRLELAKSNLPEEGDGRTLWTRCVKPAMVDLEKVVAHFVVVAMFEPPARHNKSYGYAILLDDWKALEAGKSKMVMGKALVTHERTKESARLAFWAIHFGDHNLHASVRTAPNESDWALISAEGTAAFQSADFPALIRLADRHFGERGFSLKSLFRDEQKKVLDRILGATLREVEDTYRHLHEHHAPLIRYLADLAIPQPQAFAVLAEFVLNHGLRRAIESHEIDLARIQTLLEETERQHVILDGEGLGHAFALALERLALRVQMTPSDLPALQRLRAAVNLVPTLPFEVNLWKVQNLYAELVHTAQMEIRRRAVQGSSVAAEWCDSFDRLGELLRVRIESQGHFAETTR